MNTKNIIGAIILVLVAGFGIYFLSRPAQKNANLPAPLGTSTTTSPVSAPVKTVGTDQNAAQVSIGKSVQGRDIMAYNFGTGDTHLLFVGGIHGGYEWNTSLVSYQFMDYLKQNPNAIPANVKVTVIPAANPDGIAKVTGQDGRFAAADVNPSASVQVSGRFNANTVDLNRNFDCDWKSTGVWQNKTVSGGSSAFSEPETLALKNYIEANKPAAAVVWYSAAGGVYASSCDGGVLPATDALTNAFASASGYPAHENFDSYALSGDMVNWLAKMDIPAISVLLTNHVDTEWNKNLAGIQAVLKSFSK